MYLVYLVKLDENQCQSTITPLRLQPHINSFSIFSLQFSVDGSEIICGSNDTCVYIYDLQKRKRTLRVNISEKKILMKMFI
jgi:WD40 repeat protein